MPHKGTDLCRAPFRSRVRMFSMRCRCDAEENTASTIQSLRASLMDSLSVHRGTFARFFRDRPSPMPAMLRQAAYHRYLMVVPRRQLQRSLEERAIRYMID